MKPQNNLLKQAGFSLASLAATIAFIVLVFLATFVLLGAVLYIATLYPDSLPKTVLVYILSTAIVSIGVLTMLYSPGYVDGIFAWLHKRKRHVPSGKIKLSHIGNVESPQSFWEVNNKNDGFIELVYVPLEIYSDEDQQIILTYEEFKDLVILMQRFVLSDSDNIEMEKEHDFVETPADSFYYELTDIQGHIKAIGNLHEPDKLCIYLVEHNYPIYVFVESASAYLHYLLHKIPLLLTVKQCKSKGTEKILNANLIDFRTLPKNTLKDRAEKFRKENPDSLV
jgi:hypothetical protein